MSSAEGADGPVLRTERLLLRRWRAEDSEPFARLNADPLVMEHFPAPLTRAQSDELIERIERSFATDGFGAWAVEVPGSVPLAGFVGLWRQNDERLAFAPAVEIGWRLSRDTWGRGIATEAARAAIGFGFEELELEEIVSFTTVANGRSLAVMERLGMTRDRSGDFLHPQIAADDPLAAHVLYRIRASGSG